MDQLALLFVLLLGAVVTVPLGDRLGLPAPVLMTLVGIVARAAAGFVPNVEIPPELILPLLLPPLLYASVQRTSWRQFAANMRPIFLLAVALVFVTTAAVAAVANAIVPGLPIAAAVALGALVAPPDPVAATAVAGSARAAAPAGVDPGGRGALQRRHRDRALPRGDRRGRQRHASPGRGRGSSSCCPPWSPSRVGLALGWAANKLMGLLGDATLQIGLTLLVPFASYVLAEELHGSGVLAVLTTALFLAEYATDADDVLARLAGHTFWDVVDTLVTGVAFGLIGLELHNVFGTAAGRWGEMLGWAAAVVGGGRGRTAAVAAARDLAAKRLHALRDYDEEIPTELAGDRGHVVVGDARGGLGGAGARDSAEDGRRGAVPRPGRDRLHRLRGDHGDAGAARG